MIVIQTKEGVTEAHVQGDYTMLLSDMAMLFNSLVINITKQTGLSASEVYCDTLLAIAEGYKLRLERGDIE